MIRVPDGCGDRDLAKWLNGIFLYGPERLPYRFVQVHNGVVHAYPVSDPGQTPIPVDVEQCYAHWPALGSFNVRNQHYAVHLTRHTLRLWDRTLSASMVACAKLDVLPGRAALATESFLDVPYTHAPFVPAEEALRSILHGNRESCAISRRVAVGRGLCTYKIGLFVDGELAGTVIDNAVAVHTRRLIPVVSKLFGETYAVREHA